MATKTASCVSIATRGFNGEAPESSSGWHSWSTTESTYIYKPNSTWNNSDYYRLALLRFKLPAGANIHKSVKVSVSFKVLEYPGTSDTPGDYDSFYIWPRLYEYDPSDPKLNGGNYGISHISFSGITKQPCSTVQEGSYCGFTLTSDKFTDTTKYYYVAIQTDRIITADYGKNWQVTLEYEPYANGIAPKDLKVVDEGNNQYYFTGISATEGENNKISKAEFYCTTDGSDPKSSSSREQYASENIEGFLTSGAHFNSKKNFNPPVKKRTTVKAYVKYTFEHGDPVSASCEGIVKYYEKPGNPGKPIISYTKSRFTLKESWTVNWTAATPANEDSPIKGYRIRLYKNGTGIANTIGIKDATGKVLSIQNASSTAHDLIYDRDGAGTSITIDPVQHGYEVGDTVLLQVHAYTKNGKDTKLFSAAGAASAPLTVQNAGIVHVKVDGEWKEGQVYVKADGQWKEAETVNVKVDSVWKESQ